MTLSRREWRRFLDALHLPSHAEVVDALASARDLPRDRTEDLVDEALETGPLVEDPGAGTYGTLRLVEADDTAENTALEGGSPGAIPGDDAGKTPSNASASEVNQQNASEDADVLVNNAREAFADAIAFFHAQLDRDLPDEDTSTTPREYYRDVRGWNPDTIDAAMLGWAPASDTALLDYLMREGYDRKAIIATGLFWEDGLEPIWKGRYVLPYLDEDGRPVFAISRRLGEDGHPADRAGDYGDGPAKYHKIPVSHDHVAVAEPIYGLDTVREGEPVLITEGIADAITAHQAGYPCLSPVTTTFKNTDRERLADALEERSVARAYIVQDAERPGSSADDEGRLTLPQFGEGVRGAVSTAAFLTEHGVDARIGALPRPGLEKVDLDDYLTEWDGDLRPILTSAAPVEQHPAHDPKEVALEAAERPRADCDEGGDKDGSSGNRSALFDLDIKDVTGLPWDYRGKNPLGHHGESENYYVLLEDWGVGYDHKYKAAYNALTHLLVDAGERDPESPNGSIDDGELLTAWIHAKREGLIPDDDPIPHRALRAVALDNGLCSTDEIKDGWKLPAEAFNGALDAVREEYGIGPRRDPVSDYTGGEHAIVTCEPPAPSREDLDVEARREDLEQWRYDEFLTADGPVVWADEPGAGKTTSAGRAASRRDRPHAILFDKHQKARQYQQDDPTPDGYFHLKGAEQKRRGVCMDADHADEECPEHGHPSNCPYMCPIYDIDKEHDARRFYEQLVPEVGPVRAHVILDDVLDEVPGHDDGRCPWLEQFDEVARADRLVGVHEYQTLKTVQEVRDGPRRDVILDEAVDPDSVASERQLDVEELVRLANTLDQVARYDGTPGALDALADFAHDVVDCLTDPDTPDRLEDLDAPEVNTETIRVEVDPDDLPENVDPDDVETDTIREYRGMPESGAYVNREPHYVERELLDEALAEAKLEYNETILSRIRRDDWEGAPLAIDALLAAAIDAGLDAEAGRRAIAAPETLERCPRCGSELLDRDGRRLCTPDDGGCGWDEADNHLVGQDGEAASARATLEPDPRLGDPRLTYQRLPLTSDLPDHLLLLDATATPEKIAGLYGIDLDEVLIAGDDPAALEGLHTTKVLDGQYHYSTLQESDTARDRVERTVAKLADLHDDLLVVGRLDLLADLELPGDVDTLHYHAARGLNYGDHDAVVAIGAPHPDVDTLRADAELLTQGRDDLRVGGEEHSTRRDAPNPPVYRKLDYTDAQGRGRAIPTKHYTGLVGELFREKREGELEQVIHRIRPILADGDDQKHAYLLTNVPTDLPVDEVCSFDELADPLKAMLPVADGALRLAEYVRDALEGRDVPDGFRADSLLERVGGDRGEERARFNVSELHRLAQLRGEDVSERTVRRWKDDLEKIGVLDAGAYEPREGVEYTVDQATLTRALSVIASSVGVEVAALRRFQALVEAAGGSLAWLDRARELLDLHGDRCGLDPPPDPGA